MHTQQSSSAYLLHRCCNNYYAEKILFIYFYPLFTSHFKHSMDRTLHQIWEIYRAIVDALYYKFILNLIAVLQQRRKGDAGLKRRQNFGVLTIVKRGQISELNFHF